MNKFKLIAWNEAGHKIEMRGKYSAALLREYDAKHTRRGYKMEILEIDTNEIVNVVKCSFK